MSDALTNRDAAGAAPRNQLTTAIADATCKAALRYESDQLAAMAAGKPKPPGDDFFAHIADVAIETVTTHLRACGQLGLPADARLDEAFDDYLSPPAVPATSAIRAAAIASSDEPCGDETIVAKIQPDGSYGDVRRFHPTRSRCGQNGGAR